MRLSRLQQLYLAAVKLLIGSNPYYMLERRNEEIERRKKVVRIFPDARSCLRLIRALCVEIRERWMEDCSRYLNMDLLKKQRRAGLRKLEA